MNNDFVPTQYVNWISVFAMATAMVLMALALGLVFWTVGWPGFGVLFVAALVDLIVKRAIDERWLVVSRLQTT